MAAVLADASYYRGGFSPCLSVSASRVRVAGGSTFHLDPGTISRSISRTNLSNKRNRIEKSTGIDICKYNLGVSVLSGHGESLSSLTPDQQRIPCNNKTKKTLDTLTKGKESIK